MIITNEHIGKKVYYLDDLGYGYIAKVIDIKKGIVQCITN